MRIREFDPSKMDDCRVCMVIGKRNTGKSVLTKDIMYHKRHIPAGMVVSGTEEGNGWYSSWVPELFIFNEFDAGAVERLIERQKEMRRHGEPTPVFLVLDDCMFDKKVMKQKCIRQIFMNGRHWGIFLVVTSQYVADVGPDIRSNCDYVFVLRDNVKQNQKRLYEMFFGIFDTQAAFENALTQCTEDYRCLVLDNTATSNRIEECVFWYKAGMRNFRMGSPLLWHYHSRNFDPAQGHRRLPAPGGGGRAPRAGGQAVVLQRRRRRPGTGSVSETRATGSVSETRATGSVPATSARRPGPAPGTRPRPGPAPGTRPRPGPVPGPSAS